MTYETIEFDVHEHVATVTLNRPEQLNSFTETMAREVAEAWTTIRDDNTIHCAVLRANGDRAFCTGIDIKAGMWWGDTTVFNQTDPGASLGPKQHKLWKPVVAAVHGMCAGGAQYFINECDIVICSEDAQFFDPHMNSGIVSALEPIGMLHRGVPLGDVLRWALVGNEERIGAYTALRLGLVSEVTTREELRDRAAAIASSIASRNPIAVQGTVRAIWESLEMTPSIANQNGLAYTHIGNATAAAWRESTTPSPKVPPTIR